MEEKEYSVSEISFAIKRCVETTFDSVRVKGEIFGAKRADSGHWYLSLKDQNAVLAAVCWRGVAASLKVKIEDGLEVIATGKITTFAGKSSYQLVIEQIEPAGQGALLKLLQERKQQFLKEGLFDSAHKKNLPFLPEVIGVVTSPSGAVIRDIIHRIRDRFPSRIIVWPSAVQGIGAAEQIASAIKGFDSLPFGGSIPRPDVLIVARGGGSLEDLWPFNEEEVVRAVYDCTIPVISAVGHETDTMLIDYVADRRAPTPTGAAEFAVPVLSEQRSKIQMIDVRKQNSFMRMLAVWRQELLGISRGIVNLNQVLSEYRQRFDERTTRLKTAFSYYFTSKRKDLSSIGLKSYYLKILIKSKQNLLENMTARLSALSIEQVLKRGFAWITDRHFKTVYDATNAKKSGELNIRFIDGIVKTRVAEARDAQQFDLFDD